MIPVLAHWLRRRAPALPNGYVVAMSPQRHWDRSPLPIDNLDDTASLAWRIPEPRLDITLDDMWASSPAPQEPAFMPGVPLSAAEPGAVYAVTRPDRHPAHHTHHTAEPTEGVRLQVDPHDHQRVRISGSMREVCAALEALIAVQ